MNKRNARILESDLTKLWRKIMSISKLDGNECCVKCNTYLREKNECCDLSKIIHWAIRKDFNPYRKLVDTYLKLVNTYIYSNEADKQFCKKIVIDLNMEIKCLNDINNKLIDNFDIDSAIEIYRCLQDVSCKLLRCTDDIEKYYGMTIVEDN